MRQVLPSLVRVLVIVLFLAAGEAASAQDLCSNYQSRINCVGKKRPYVRYAHVEAYPNYKSGRQLSPGDPLGTTIPLRRTPCHASREHVHYELRIDADPKRHIDPHAYWADGPAKVTCYRNGMTVPPGKAVALIRCVP